MRYEFAASRISGDDNAIFPNMIIIDDTERFVQYRKDKIIGCNETKVGFSAIGSLSVNKHVLFADIIIETTGGKTIVAKGFSRDDADTIVRLLDF